MAGQGTTFSFLDLASTTWLVVIQGTTRLFGIIAHCRHIIHDIPSTLDVITDYDPKSDILDFSALYFEVALETYEYLKETILDLFPVQSGTMHDQGDI
jgi:DNA primase